MNTCFGRCLRFESHTVLRNIRSTYTWANDLPNGPRLPAQNCRFKIWSHLEGLCYPWCTKFWDISIRNSTNFRSNAFLLFSLAKLQSSQVEDMWCDLFPVKIPTVNFPDDLSFSFHASQTLSSIIGTIKEAKSSRYYMYEMMWYNIMYTFNTGILHIFWTDDHLHLHLHHTSTEASFTGMTPVISDQFDTVKDVLFAGLCFQSDSRLLQILGISSSLAPDIPGWLIETCCTSEKM